MKDYVVKICFECLYGYSEYAVTLFGYPFFGDEQPNTKNWKEIHLPKPYGTADLMEQPEICLEVSFLV
jgi:hypothetical protein